MRDKKKRSPSGDGEREQNKDKLVEELNKYHIFITIS
jgi:hypothetical protein